MHICMWCITIQNNTLRTFLNLYCRTFTSWKELKQSFHFYQWPLIFFFNTFATFVSRRGNLKRTNGHSNIPLQRQRMTNLAATLPRKCSLVTKTKRPYYTAAAQQRRVEDWCVSQDAPGCGGICSPVGQTNTCFFQSAPANLASRNFSASFPAGAATEHESLADPNF